MRYRINLRHLFIIIAIQLLAVIAVFADDTKTQITNQIEINLNDYVLDGESTLNPKARATSHIQNDNFSIKVDLSTKSFIIPHPEHSELSFYNELSESEKIKFHKKRISALNILARGLLPIRRGLGFGAVVKDKVMFWKSKNEKSKIPFNERSELIVEQMIRSFDKNIWSSAPIFTQLTELGVTGTGQIAAAIGSEKRLSLQKQIAGKQMGITVPEMKSGGSIGIGFTLGINFEQRSLVFQVFNVNEQLKETKIPLLLLAGTVKGGIYISNSKENLYSSDKSESLYPLAAPGYIESAPNKKTFGTSMSMGIPLAFGYSNHMQQQSYLRISISPFTWKFISISLKNPFGIIKVGFTNIPTVIKEVGRVYNQLYYARSCKGLFL